MDGDNLKPGLDPILTMLMPLEISPKLQDVVSATAHSQFLDIN